MNKLRSLPNSPRIDAQEAIACVLSEQPLLVKTNRLRDLSPDGLFEMCSLAGIDTAPLPLERKSIFPKSDSMINALLQHTNMSYSS
jgi:hypothetical protein